MSAKPNADDLAKQLLFHGEKPALNRDCLHFNLGNGFVLKADWFDHKNVLAGSIEVPEKGFFPIIEQRILEIKSGVLVREQTEEQACAAFAQDAIRLIEKITAVA